MTTKNIPKLENYLNPHSLSKTQKRQMITNWNSTLNLEKKTTNNHPIDSLSSNIVRFAYSKSG